MSVGWILVITGAIAWSVASAYKSLFVNTTDVHNPYRRLNATVRYVGLLVAAWGVFLLLVYRGES